MFYRLQSNNNNTKPLLRFKTFLNWFLSEGMLRNLAKIYSLSSKF